MKSIVTFLLLFVSLLAFSQEKKSVSSGYITFNSGTTLEFKNLVIEGDNVTYLSGADSRETKVSKNGIKKIVDNTGAAIYESGKVNQVQYEKAAVATKPATVAGTAQEKLEYKSAHKLFLNGKRLSDGEIESLFKPAGLYEDYKSGRSNAVLGDVLMGGGLGLFIGGGVSNIINANKGNSGGPGVLIAGVVVGVIGIPIKISGAKKIKNVVNQYNSIPPKNVAWFGNPELKLTAGAGTVGLQLKF